MEGLQDIPMKMFPQLRENRSSNNQPDNQVTIGFPWKKIPRFYFYSSKTRTRNSRFDENFSLENSRFFLQNLGNYTFAARSLSKLSGKLGQIFPASRKTTLQLSAWLKRKRKFRREERDLL